MNRRIFGLLSDSCDWKQYLRDPSKHWKVGKSARTLAHCWQEQDGLPICVKTTLKGTVLDGMTMLLGIPEYEADMPGRGFGSKSDIMVLAHSKALGLVTIAVEGKVEEGFGETVEQWLSSGKSIGSHENRAYRFDGICKLLSVGDVQRHTLKLRPYQLLHRTASAVVTATAFGASTAVMMVHSFDTAVVPHGLKAYWDFCQCLTTSPSNSLDAVSGPYDTGSIRVYFVWVNGHAKWLTD